MDEQTGRWTISKRIGGLVDIKADGQMGRWKDVRMNRRENKSADN
jgi:hypothetical protein